MATKRKYGKPGPRVYSRLNILHTVEHGYREEESCSEPDHKAVTDGARNSSGRIKAVFRQMNSAVETSEAIVGVDQHTQEHKETRLPSSLVDERVPYVVIGLLRFGNYQTGNASHEE